jgi:hypothetical protein
MLEAPSPGLKKRAWLGRCADIRTTSNSASCVVLAETELGGAELLQCYEAIDNVDFGNLLGETFNGSPKAVYSGLRDAGSR